ncbi:MAG: hypothetical protein HQ481_00860 [Alphaproteobacteria bacterium]|nr:hypothetical protein [Alphaproteobacteria bacterium]
MSGKGGPDDGAYTVGYGRPPARTRFKPGQSGNPKGRPKGARNLKTDLQAEMAERITVQEAGRSKTITKQRAFLKALMAKAIKGHVPAAQKLIDLIIRLMEPEEGAGDAVALSPEEQEILEVLSQRRPTAPDAEAVETAAETSAP